MLNKRIKSVLIAGIVILGMGFAKVDSYAAELSADNPAITIPGNDDYAINYQDGEIQVRIDYLNGEYSETTYINTFTFCTTWKKELYKVNGIEIKYAINGGEECLIEKEIENQNGMFSFNKEFEPGVNVEIKSVKVDYDLIDDDEQQQPVGDGKVDAGPYITVNSIYTKYKENMDALGDINGDVRTITEAAAITESSWTQFVNDFNNENNLMKIESEDDDTYKVYVLFNEQKELVETIEIKFFDANKKGWLPEITPGTGQALAVGGIVIGAAAAVGLLVNNRKRKDEE